MPKRHSFHIQTRDVDLKGYYYYCKREAKNNEPMHVVVKSQERKSEDCVVSDIAESSSRETYCNVAEL